MKILTIVLALFIAGVTPASAARWYVDSDRDGTSCSRRDPCRTVQAAVDLAGPGDSIRVRAGVYVENVVIPPGKNGLTIRGSGARRTVLESAGGRPGVFAPATVPADVIVDVFASDVTLRGLTFLHPEGETKKRDIGVFVRPPAANAVITRCNVQRKRGGNLEPTAPGSRGVLVFRATGTVISRNRFRGNYEDHIHLPTSETTVWRNSAIGATRIGIVVIQESDTSRSVDNEISRNLVKHSGSDGIQIQGDDNWVVDNRVRFNDGVGVHLCGAGSTPSCVAPGGKAEASGNAVFWNWTRSNAGGDVVDNGAVNNVY